MKHPCAMEFIPIPDMKISDNNWLSAKDNPPKLKEMLVVCKECNHVHAVFWDYEDYNLPEWCGKGGPSCPGKVIDFDWYMPLPELPKQES